MDAYGNWYWWVLACPNCFRWLHKHAYFVETLNGPTYTRHAIYTRHANLHPTCNLPEGVIWGQQWYGFCMLLGQVALTGEFQAQLWCDSNASELETYQLGPPASAAATWTLLFEQPYAVSDQPAHQTEWCLVFRIPYNKEIPLQKQWNKKSKWLARYANLCTIPHGEHLFRVQVHDVCM